MLMSMLCATLLPALMLLLAAIILLLSLILLIAYADIVSDAYTLLLARCY